MRSQGVSIANNLPDSQSNNDPASTSSNRRTEEVTNYEITKTIRNAVRDEGLIVNRLSAAVVVNALDANGNIIERSNEDIERIESLVKSAIGFDETRGDQVEIASIAFNTPEPILSPAAPVQTAGTIEQNNILRYTEISVLCLIAGALVFFVLRPMLLNASNNTSSEPITPNYMGAATDTNSQSLDITNPDQPHIGTTAPNMIEQRIKIAQIDGQVKASSVNQIQEIVKGHKDESAIILKRWIREAI